MTSRIPITIFNGFLGAGKTTIILNLLKQLDAQESNQSTETTTSTESNQIVSESTSMTPNNNDSNQNPLHLSKKRYSVVWIKNEFGVNEIDSILAQQSSITSVKEITNGCICCTLVGRLSDSLYEILIDNNIQCDRIIIETSGSAFPATLVQEINRVSTVNNNNPTIILDSTPHLATTLNPTQFQSSLQQQQTTTTSKQDTSNQDSIDNTSTTTVSTITDDNKQTTPRQLLPVYIDGVICVVDALNYFEYNDTSFTAKIQAQYTDLILLNKHELIQQQENNTETSSTSTNTLPTSPQISPSLDKLKDLLLELNPECPIVKTNKGFIDYQVVFGLDSRLWVNNNNMSSNDSNNSNTNNGHLDDKSFIETNTIPDGLADVDVVHLEWITPVTIDSNTTLSNECNIRNQNQFINPITIDKFEIFLNSLYTFNCLRAKGIILLQLTIDQYNIIVHAHDSGITFSSKLLLSQSVITNPISTQLITVPIILNWSLGRWSFYPIPHFIPNFDTILSSTSTSNNNNNNTNIQYTIPSTILQPSSLYHTPIIQPLDYTQYHYLHNRLTLFGASNTIATFSFQKMITRHLPVSIRSQCCPIPTPTHSHDHQQHQHGSTTNKEQCCTTTSKSVIITPKPELHYGGFVTILSKEHSHNHNH